MSAGIGDPFHADGTVRIDVTSATRGELLAEAHRLEQFLGGTYPQSEADVAALSGADLHYQQEGWDMLRHSINMLLAAATARRNERAMWLAKLSAATPLLSAGIATAVQQAVRWHDAWMAGEASHPRDLPYPAYAPSPQNRRGRLRNPKREPSTALVPYQKRFVTPLNPEPEKRLVALPERNPKRVRQLALVDSRGRAVVLKRAQVVRPSHTSVLKRPRQLFLGALPHRRYATAAAVKRRRRRRFDSDDEY